MRCNLIERRQENTVIACYKMSTMNTTHSIAEISCLGANKQEEASIASLSQMQRTQSQR
jgi:hypothetical protein